jgi:hypothetical protein
MSRYVVKVGETTFAYGFDRPLQEYFLQKHTPGEGDYPDVEDLVGSMTGGGYGTAGELLEAVQRLNLPLPPDHLIAVCLDQPF